MLQRFATCSIFLFHCFLGAVLISSISDFVWLNEDNTTMSTPNSKNIISSKASKEHVYISPILNAHLFGYNKDTTQPNNLDHIDAPQTKLRLQLRGIFDAKVQADSIAIIAQKGQKQKAYYVGGILPGNATLEAIYAEYVLIKQSNTFEKLLFETYTKNPSNTKSIFVARYDGNKNVGKIISRAKRQINHNPEAFFREIGFRPLTKGINAGYRFNGKAQTSKTLGLQKGDVVLSVNGHKLGNLNKDKILLDKIALADTVKLKIKRGTKQYTVSYPLNAF